MNPARLPPPRPDRSREALLERFGPGIWGLCKRLAAEPEDAYQDVWAHLFSRVERFDPAGTASLKTWLHTVAHRRLIDRHRAARGRVVLPFSEEPAEPTDLEQSVVERRRKAALEHAIEALPEGQRRVVLAHHLSGLPLDRVAALEGVAVGTVKSRLHRARARLAELLEAHR